MFNYFLTTFVRSLKRDKTHNIINIGGLAVGLTCALIIFLVVKHELSYDQHHDNKESIYRLVFKVEDGQDISFGAGVNYPLPAALKNDLSNVEAVTLIDNVGLPVISVGQGDKTEPFQVEKGFAYVQPDFFKIFKYDWVAGDPETALTDPFSVVLSTSMAKKFFKDDDPIGQVIGCRTFSFNQNYNLTVTGLVEDPKGNTDIPFNMLISTNLGSEFKRYWGDPWTSTSSNFQCYLKVAGSTSGADVASQIATLLQKYKPSEEDDAALIPILQPLDEIHFDERFNNFNNRVVTKTTLYSLGIIALLLLITASVNFVNLNTALATRRGKEVGIRKILGGSKGQLVSKFMGETALIVVLAIVLSIGLTELALVKLPQLLNQDFSYSLFEDLTILGFLFLLLVLVTLMAGLYPSILIAGFNPVTALKNKVGGTYGKGISLRKILVVVQLSITQLLMLCTIVVVSQMRFFKEQPIGIDKEAVVEFLIPNAEAKTLTILRNHLSQHSGVINATFSNTGAISSSSWNGNFQYKDDDQSIDAMMNIKFIDENFVPTYGISLIAGENLTDSDSTDAILVNEMLLKTIQISNPLDAIGKNIDWWGTKAVIKGVVKDFNQRSLHDPIVPIIMARKTSDIFVGAVKVNTADLSTTLDHIKKSWEAVFPALVYEYDFLEDTIASFYEGEQKVANLLNIFSVIAILIGCVGLFGLISFMGATRTKEIGIRKTFGATVWNILGLFSVDFIWLTIIAFAVAAPISYYLMREWLKDFTYRIPISWPMFVFAILISAGLVLITIWYKSIRAASANPIDALRDE